MKDKITIEIEMNFLKDQYQKEKDRHHRMCQIDMQSGEGSQCRENINKLDGKITALKWVLGGY